ncbi:MAG: hypothetical protein J0L53_18480 [Spirochaetes bacterium]|nr:hypothetical protein [Spirochaetota bacterium]
MAKENSIARIADITAENVPKSVTDPETGLKIKVSQEMVASLITAERQIVGGMEQIALALHRIRQDKLFLIYGLNSMSEYLERRFSFSERLGYFLLKMADVFGDSKFFQDIMKQPRKLLEIAAKNPAIATQMKEDGEITLPNGSVIMLSELKKNTINEVIKDYAKTKEKNSQLSNDLEEKEKELKDAHKVIRNYEKRADLDEDYFKKITTKAEALTEILSIEAEAASMMQRLDAIESEEPTVVAKLAATISMVLAGFSQVQSKYMHLILDVDGAKKD